MAIFLAKTGTLREKSFPPIHLKHWKMCFWGGSSVRLPDSSPQALRKSSRDSGLKKIPIPCRPPCILITSCFQRFDKTNHLYARECQALSQILGWVLQPLNQIGNQILYGTWRCTKGRFLLFLFEKNTQKNCNLGFPLKNSVAFKNPAKGNKNIVPFFVSDCLIEMGTLTDNH